MQQSLYGLVGPIAVDHGVENTTLPIPSATIDLRYCSCFQHYLTHLAFAPSTSLGGLRLCVACS